jgi:pimeloyl-ACP methyl ester carboxylesterase
LGVPIQLHPARAELVGDGTVTLADGRRLGWAEHGASDGRPLVWHHGTPGSRLTFLAGDAAARAGVRVIVVERPGFGRSDPMAGRRVSDWPRDLEAFADAHGLDRFAIGGTSGGGPYIIAAAHALASRVTSATMVACAGPFSGSEHDMAVPRRLFLALLRRSPGAAESMLRVAFGARHESFYRAMSAGLSSSDARILARPDVWNLQLSSVREALRQGYGAFVHEVALAAEPWRVALESIDVPVRIFHGTEDRSTPITMARTLAARLPRATLEVVEGEGHFLLVDHASRILESA